MSNMITLVVRPMNLRGLHLVACQGPTTYFISFLVGFIKNLGFRRVTLKCDNEPITIALQDAVIHACVGVEVIPQGLREGDHMANGRVEMAVRQ